MTIENLKFIPGPCAAENRAQMILSAEEALKRGCDTARLSLFKPRTKPGFEGMGYEGIPILFAIAQMGIRPATEVMLPQHVDSLMNGVLGNDSQNKLLLWLGSRNQNNLIQSDIGRVIAGEPRVMLMVKNQMWSDKNHWIGIVEHIMQGGTSIEQIMLCHRGFAPRLNGFRNPPDLNIALQVKHKLSKQHGIVVPLILDPSHIAGDSPENVMKVAIDLWRESLSLCTNSSKIDGMMIEVHPNPEDAQTDREQQLTWAQLDLLISQLKNQS